LRIHVVSLASSEHRSKVLAKVLADMIGLPFEHIEHFEPWVP
jgi:hypothetical protein